MNEEKSPIQSFGVSLGSAPIPSLTAKPLEPWNVLICSDLGFKSSKPEALRISDWNEFMASKKIVLSGNVENVLEKVGTAFFVEYPLNSLKDISAENMLEKIKPVSGYYRAYCALRKLLAGTNDEAEALSVIESSNMPTAEKSIIRPMLGKSQPAAAHKPRENAPRSGINSILSMVDFGEELPKQKTDTRRKAPRMRLLRRLRPIRAARFKKGLWKYM